MVEVRGLEVNRLIDEDEVDVRYADAQSKVGFVDYPEFDLILRTDEEDDVVEVDLLHVNGNSGDFVGLLRHRAEAIVVEKYRNGVIQVVNALEQSLRSA